MNPARISNLARLADVGHQCRFHHVSQRTDNRHAPRRLSVGGLVVTGFPSDIHTLRLHHAIRLPVVIKARRTLPFLDVCLRNQHEHTVGRLY